jgi:hypothetical protein
MSNWEHFFALVLLTVDIEAFESAVFDLTMNMFFMCLQTGDFMFITREFKICFFKLYANKCVLLHQDSWS